MSLKIDGSVLGYNNCYHFHASPKYRQDAFNIAIATRLKQLLQAKSTELGWTIHAIEVDSDHLHFLIESIETPSAIAQRLFGYTSKVLREEFPELKEINSEHFWGGKQCKPIVDEEHLKNTLKYILRHEKV